MWEFPTFEKPPLAGQLRARFGARFEIGAELLTHRQVISNRKVTQRVFAATPLSPLLPLGPQAHWLEPAAIAALGITTATRRILARLDLDAPMSAGATSAAVSAGAAARPRRPRARAR
jgi:hypothetical protein